MWNDFNDVGTQVSYRYDARGRLKTVTVDKRNGTAGDPAEVTAYGYDALGSIATVTYPNGSKATYTYDQRNRLTGLVNKNSAEQVLSEYSYTLATDGMRESMVETDHLGRQSTLQWDYDNMNRLTGELCYETANPANVYYEDQYVYDLVGNRRIKAENGSELFYFYNDNDELTKVASDSDGNDVLAKYFYDGNGSLIKLWNESFGGGPLEGPYDRFEYDLQNRLKKFIKYDGGTTVEYGYDPAGVRVRKTVNGSDVTEYLIDPYNHTGYAQVFKEISTSDVNTAYIIGNDVIGQAKGQSEPNYFLYDGHGSVRQLADKDGDIVESYGYDAYGNAVGFDPNSALSRLLYAGEFYDKHTGYYYLRARYYDAMTARFNRMDEFLGNHRDPQSLHKYLYAHCNPIMNADPTGQFSLTGTVKVVAISATISTAIYTSYRIDALGVRTYRRGIDKSIVTDKDIADFLNGLRTSRRGLELFTQKTELAEVPHKWDKLWELLENQGIYQVGLLGEGVVGRGQTESVGYQQLIRYYETRIWNWFNPQATPHRSPAAYHGVDNPSYIMDFGGWGIQRYGVIARDLIEKARDRGTPVPTDVEAFLNLSNVKGDMDIRRPYPGNWR